MGSYIVLFVVILSLALIFFVVPAIKFVYSFKQVSLGMTYNEVVYIADEPYKVINTDNIKICLWRIAVLQGWHLERIVVFKDGIVVSKHNNSHYA